MFGSFLEFDIASMNQNHPTQKPKALLERIIKASSNPDDIIMDPFSGTFIRVSLQKSLEEDLLELKCRKNM